MVSGTQPDSPRPAIEQDGAEMPAGSPAPERTGSIPSESGSESGNDGSGELRATHPLDRARALAAELEPEAFDGSNWASEETRRAHQDRAIYFAIKVIDAGWVRVSVDDTTVERVAESCRGREAVRFAAREVERGGNARLTPWPELPEHTRDWYRERVRDVLAAVQALRDGGTVMADTYGARLKACRRAAGLSQTEFATKVGLSRSSIANIEAGRQRSLLDDVPDYAEVLGVDPAWLAFGRATVDGPPLPLHAPVSEADLAAVLADVQRAASALVRHVAALRGGES